jgi:hypothetical protein
MESDFQALVFSRPEGEMSILKGAAARFIRGEEEALLVCRVYYPDMPTAKARDFLKWLARESGASAQKGGAVRVTTSGKK